MNIKAFFVVASFVLPTYANAAFVTSIDSTNGPGRTSTPVAEVHDMWDDLDVVVEGYITQHIHGDLYTFRDETGLIQVEMEHEDFSGLDISSSDKIRLYGVIDRFFQTSIDASRIVALSECSL